MLASNSPVQTGSFVDQSPLLLGLYAVVAIGIIAGLVIAFFSAIRGRRSGLIPVSRVQLAGASILLGLVMSVMCGYFGNHDLLQDIIAGCVVAILVVQVGEVLRHEASAEKLVSLERALDEKETFSRVNKQLDYLDSIDGVVAEHPKLRPFAEEVLAQSFSQLNTKLDALSKAAVVVDQVHRELTINKDFLEQLPDEFVHAVSYEDETFWDEPQGRDFLDAHRSIIKKGRKIKRIFILKKDKAKDQSATIRVQYELGVECSIVYEEKLQPMYCRDFVLYDDKYVRFGETIMYTHENALKKATLSADETLVADYAEKFAFLAAQSESAITFFAKEWAP